MRIVSLLTLAGLGLSTQAFAAPTLSVSGSCGGATTAVTDATNYRLVFGEAGAYTVPGGSCADTALGVMGSASAPMSDSETTFVLNETHCGASAQVIDMDTCEVSAVVVLPTEDAYDMGYDDGYLDGEASVDITSDNADVYDDGYADGLADCDTSEEPGDCASDDPDWGWAISKEELAIRVNDMILEDECDAFGFTWNDMFSFCEMPDDFDAVSPALCTAVSMMAIGSDDGGYECGYGCDYIAYFIGFYYPGSEYSTCLTQMADYPEIGDLVTACPVACHAPGACSTDGIECAFDDADEDTYDDASFDAGVSSVDITSDNDAAYGEGYAAGEESVDCADVCEDDAEWSYDVGDIADCIVLGGSYASLGVCLIDCDVVGTWVGTETTTGGCDFPLFSDDPDALLAMNEACPSTCGTCEEEPTSSDDASFSDENDDGYDDATFCAGAASLDPRLDCDETPLWEPSLVYSEHMCLIPGHAPVAAPECLVESFCMGLTESTSALTDVTEGDCRSEEGTASWYDAGLALASEAPDVYYLYYTWCYDLRDVGTLPDPVETTEAASGDTTYECPPHEYYSMEFMYAAATWVPGGHMRVQTSECLIEGFCLEIAGASSPYTAGADTDCESETSAAQKAEGAALATSAGASDNMSVVVDSLNNAWCH